jgi:hypothetical protein
MCRDAMKSGKILHCTCTGTKPPGVKKARIAASRMVIGAACRIRTDDLPLTRELEFVAIYGFVLLVRVEYYPENIASAR